MTSISKTGIYPGFKKLDKTHEEQGDNTIREYALKWGAYKIREENTMESIKKFIYADLLEKMELSNKEKEETYKFIEERIIKNNEEINSAKDIKKNKWKVISVPTKLDIEAFVKDLRKS